MSGRYIERNMAFNRERLGRFSGQIYSQCAPPVNRLKYGRFGNIDYSGCGAAAIYNALRLAGQPRDLCEVIAACERLKLPRAGALLGTKPFAVGRAFRYYNIPYKKYTNADDFIRQLEHSTVGVICTWNKRMWGTHFYCLYRRGKRYYALNYSCRASRPEPFTVDKISPFRFIVGYVLS